MSIFKLFFVLALCAAQVHFITAFFKGKGPGGSAGRRKDVNPFANSVI